MLGDPALLAALASATESIINESLRYDPGSRESLKKLQGERLAIIITDRAMVIQLDIYHSQINVHLCTLQAFDDSDASTILRGDLPDFVTLLRKNTHSLAGTGIDAQGNIGTLETLQNIIKNIDIDWQDALHQKLGPGAAPLNKLITSLAQYLKDIADSKTLNLKHFLQYESGLGVQKEEMNAFRQQVADLRQASDRLEARIQHMLKNPALRATSTKDDT